MIRMYWFLAALMLHPVPTNSQTTTVPGCKNCVDLAEREAVGITPTYEYIEVDGCKAVNITITYPGQDQVLGMAIISDGEPFLIGNFLYNRASYVYPCADNGMYSAEVDGEIKYGEPYWGGDYVTTPSSGCNGKIN